MSYYYGYPHTGADPRYFRPDRDHCTAEEIAAWEEARTLAEAGEEYVGSRDAINKIIGTEYTRADGTTAFIGFAAGSAWGIGTYDDGEEEEAWEEMEDGDWLEWEVQP